MLSLRFKQELAKLLCTQLKNQIKTQQLTDYEGLLIPCHEWTNKHYELASELIGVSASSVRRVFLPEAYLHESFNTRTKAKYAVFLGFRTWQEIEKMLVNRLAA